MTTEQNSQSATEPENNLAPQTDEQSPSDEGSPQEPQQTDADTPPDPKPKPRDAQERIRELIAREKAAIEYADYWKNKATQGVKPPAKEAPKDLPAPKLADFKGDTETWAEAYAKWTEKRIETRTAAAAERTSAAALESSAKQRAEQAWASRRDAYAAANPEFIEVLQFVGVRTTETMNEIIMNSEKGPEIAEFLGTNPGELAKISRLSPAYQAAALGRLEAKLEKPPEKPKVQTTNAPEPPTPVAGGGVSRVDIESMTPSQYLDYKMKKAAGGKR